MNHEQFVRAVDALAHKLCGRRPTVAALLGVNPETFKAYCDRPGTKGHRTPPPPVVVALRDELARRGVEWPAAA